MTTATASTRIQGPNGCLIVRAILVTYSDGNGLADDAKRAVKAAAARLEAMVLDGSWTRAPADAAGEYHKAMDGEIDAPLEDTDFYKLLRELESAAEESATKEWANPKALVWIEVE